MTDPRPRRRPASRTVPGPGRRLALRRGREQSAAVRTGRSPVVVAPQQGLLAQGAEGAREGRRGGRDPPPVSGAGRSP
ncbi:hypothetical protein RKD46_004744 [Streptomyces pseudovenezuelae]|uniref:hypothetical protein n=1 Tax=Streptomyces sp. SAI-208 TaxID=2940550 RepID=UPI00247665AC|nr:hypothetical protein [Streptomyces sp. SAI-208]